MARAITRQRRFAFRAAVAAEDRGEVGAVAAAEGPREGFFRVRLGSFEVNITISQHIFLIYSVCLSVCLRILSVSRITCFRVTELFFEYQIYISNFSWVLILSSLQRTMAPVVVVPSRTTMLAEPQS